MNPALKQVSEFKGDPNEMNRRVVQFERNAAEVARENDQRSTDIEARVQTKVLETDFTKTSSTVLADVPDLFAEIGASETLAITWNLYGTFAGGGGIKVAVIVPVGATLKLFGVGNGGSSNIVIATTTTPGAAINLTPGALVSTGVFTIFATVINAGVPGQVTLRAAQNASNATPTNINAMSHMCATRAD